MYCMYVTKSDNIPHNISTYVSNAVFILYIHYSKAHESNGGNFVLQMVLKQMILEVQTNHITAPFFFFFNHWIIMKFSRNAFQINM